MRFQIKEIILWPRKTEQPPRRVKFEGGKVNVISGASRTGKSAVIPIIDYCLAANSCGIPVKTIRDACSWFGIVIATDGGEKLFARREPGAQRITDDMFVMEGQIVEVPPIITKNTGADRVRRMLDELCGLSNLDFAPVEGTPSGFDARPSFRDLITFVFQPQNVIANPDVLFFKTNTYEHREKLRKIFPYILSAVTPALLAKQHELNRLQRELRRKEKELRDAQEVSAQWLADLRVRVSEAQELGLLPQQPGEHLTRERMVALLQGIVSRTDLTLSVSANTISEAVRELTSLESEEDKVSNTLTGLRRRLAEMNRIRESARSYQQGLRIQRDRLQISDWLVDLRRGDENCPFCGSDMEPAAQKLDELRTSLRQLEEASGESGEIPAVFERELERVQSEVHETTEKLKAIKVRRDALTRRSTEAQNLQYRAQRVERFVGNLENALELYRRLGEDSDMRAEVESLRYNVQQLQVALRADDIESRKRRVLQIINANAGRLLPELDAERPDDPISLETDDLTIKVLGTDREDYLSEIGSGSNWLSYHIAVMLGLHQFFLSLENSPVPGFLVIDQPSQVYFPKKVATREDEETEEPQFTRDEDIEAVQKAFRVLGNVAGRAAGRFQTIVLDHAPKSIWGQLPNVVEVEEWRNGRKLVPFEWLI